MTTGRWILAMALLGVVSSAQAEPVPATSDMREALVKSIRAQRELARELAPVKSLSDFYTYIQQDNAAARAFRKLGATEQEAFANSLVFNEKGLASFNYKVVEDSLAVREAFSLLSAFGVQHVVRSLKGLKIENQTDAMVLDAMPTFAPYPD